MPPLTAPLRSSKIGRTAEVIQTKRSEAPQEVGLALGQLASMLLVEKGAHGSNRGGRLLLHEPMPRSSNDHLLHVRRSGAHDDCHGRSEGLLAADRQHWHGQLAFG